MADRHVAALDRKREDKIALENMMWCGVVWCGVVWCGVQG